MSDPQSQVSSPVINNPENRSPGSDGLDFVINLNETSAGPRTPQELDCDIDDKELTVSKNYLIKDGFTPIVIIENFKTKYKGRFNFV
jgi:hypothetical protein